MQPKPEREPAGQSPSTDRRPGEAGPPASERRFREFADSAPAMLWVTEPDGRCSFLSRGWYEFTGQSEAEALGLGWLEAVHPDDRGDAGRAFLAANERQGPFRCEYRVRRADGVYRWAIDIGRPRHAPGGEYLGYVGSVIEIHDRKQAEEEKRRLDERRRLALDAAQLGSWNIDPETQGLESDERFRAIFGGTSDPIGLERAFALIHAEDRDRVRAAVEAAMQPEDPVPYAAEFRVVHADGSVRWVFGKGRAHFAGEGGGRRLASFDGTVADITDRKRAEEALRASEERYRTLFETMDDGFCVAEMIFDPAGRPVDYRILEMNPAFEGHTGLRGVAGKTVQEFAPDLDAFWFEAYGRVAVTGEPARFVHQAEALGGRWFDVSATRLGGPGSRKVAILFKDISARERAEQERERLLKEVETEKGRLAEVFQRAPSFMCVLRGPGHRFERINDRYYQLVGHRDLLGKPAREALPEVEGQGFFELLDQVYRTGEAFVGTDMPVLLQRNPGDTPEERSVDLVYQALRDPDGTVTGLLAQGIDQTERKRAEGALRAKTERLDLLLENTKDYAVVITDPEGTVIEWQGGAERITGFAPAEVLGRKAHLIFTPEDRESGRPEAEMRDAAQAGRSEDKRWHLRKDGSRFFADGVMTALLDEGGSLRGFGKVFKDATGEMQAGEATRRRAAQLQGLADVANRINTARDVNSVIEVVTREALALFGVHRAATSMVLDLDYPQPINVVSHSGKPPPGGDAPGFPEAIRPEAGPIGLTRGEIEADPRWRASGAIAATTPAGDGRLAAPLIGPSGKAIGLIQLSGKEEGEFTEDDEAILVQLARLAAIAIENARLYQELRANDERKDEFLAMLAHELRNPLAAIGNAVKLASATGAREQLDWSIGVITRQMRHLARLIDDLMDVSRITRGKIELRRDVIDLAPLLESAAATVGALVEERGHTLELAVDRGALWVDVDPTRLEQVVVNLLNNAAKYSEDGGHIRLSARAEAGEVVVGVKDRGLGIPPERLPEMFELFAQGDRSLARSEGGLGIGLTVVKKLVEMHGGAVQARSDGPGRGSEFTIRLPAATGPARARPARGGRAGPPARRARILVVDDNVDTARGMARLLRLTGHEVATAHNGPDAIEEAGALRPEFVLLDIGLPGMSGYEVAAQLRREECCKGAVIVAVSGYGQGEDRRRSKEAGFDHHLTKPLDHDALLALLSDGGEGQG